MARRSSAPAPKAKPSKRVKGEPLDDERLIALIEERESRASRTSSFQDDQAKALRYYLGQPMGNEVEDRSQVVMREIYSTIEWIKPALLRMFFGGDSVVKFTPKGPEDVKQAEQETEVVQHVVMSQNDGFSTFYTWITDALLMRNGYVVAYWDEREDVTESSYRNLSLEEVTMMVQDRESEILEAEERPGPTGEPIFDVRLRYKDKTGKVQIDAVPPERVLVDANYKHVGLSRCEFVEYWEEKTLSALREEGFDVADDLRDSDEENNFAGGRDMVANARLSRDATATSQEDDDADPASRRVKVRTIFLRVDFDGDGIAEMRRLVVVGREVLQNEVYDRVLMACITPTIMPHRHAGMSVADAVMDLQEIKTMLMRGMLDNMYLANNGRFAINEETVNLDDFLTTRPGGVVRVAGDPGMAITPLLAPALGAPIIQTIEYVDNVLENRTGASPRVLQGQSFDGNAINKTATGINAVMSAAMARIELIARVFAETGIKELFQIVHMLLLKHGQKPLVMKLRNQFTPVDPREWQKRTDMTVEVGLGVGDKQAKIALLQMITTAQQALMPMGLANPQTLFNGLSKIVTEAGFKDPEEFFVDPAKAQQQGMQPPPDPRAMAEQAKISFEAEKAKKEAELRELEISSRMQTTQMQLELERSKAFLSAQVDLAKHSMSQDASRESESAGRRERLAEKGFNERGQPAVARRKIVRHMRGPDGRIAASEVVEVDDQQGGGA